MYILTLNICFSFITIIKLFKQLNDDFTLRYFLRRCLLQVSGVGHVGWDMSDKDRMQNFEGETSLENFPFGRPIRR
jgi:hypothetical protein